MHPTRPAQPHGDAAGVQASPAAHAAPGPGGPRALSSAGAAMVSLLMACFGWIAGTGAQMFMTELPARAVSVCMLAAALLLALSLGFGAPLPAQSGWRFQRRFEPRDEGVGRSMGWPRWGPVPRALLWLVVAALAAHATVSLRAHERLGERLPAPLEGRDVVVTGLVAQLPRSGVQGTRFLFEVESAQVEGRAVTLPPLLSLGWYRSAEADALLLGPQVDVRAGQRWRFTVRLKQPHGPFNPGGFDLELWLFERGIGATGQVRASAGAAAQLLEERAGAPIERARQQVRDAIEQRLLRRGEIGAEERDAGAATTDSRPFDARAAGVIAALAVGDQAAIERDDWDTFRVTGVAHLMSISGLHVTMFAWLAGGLIGALWRRSERAVLWLPSPRAARWGGVAVALAYALFAGWGVPAQRTVCMLATVAALQSLGARWPLHAVLGVVAAVVLAFDPWACMQPGFWLSFVAVGLLAAAEPGGPAGRGELADAGGEGLARHARQAWATVREALRGQAVATVGLAPLSMVFFQQVSLVGFVANLVAIPVVTLLVTPLALLGVLMPPLWDVAAFVLSGLVGGLQWLAAGARAGWPSAVPGVLPAVWQAAAAPAWAMAAGLLGGLVAVLPVPWRVRLFAVPLMLPLLVPPVARPAEGRFEMVALDIGQGTAVLVRTRTHLLVYDAGPGFSPEADAGSRLVLPLLRWRGERHIDHLVLSHRDTDHVGGAASLLAAVPVARMSSSLEEAHPLQAAARDAGAAVGPCQAGQRWSWDGVPFEVLHPAPGDVSGPGVKPNAVSCVLRVGAGRSSVLLTGDIEAPQEAALVGQLGPDLQAGVLLVPHHGSRTSSTAAFVDAVGPRLAIVQAAYRSRYGHPAPDVLARYEARGIVLKRSDRCGALTLNADGAVRCEREAARRYWHHRVDERAADASPGN